MPTNEEVRFALNRYIRGLNPKSGKVCNVKNVSADPLTGLMICDCEDIENDVIIEDVRLSADFNDNTTSAGLILVPKLNSIVIVSFLNETEAFISMVSEVDYIYLNGNTYGGVPMVNPMVTKYNNLENLVNKILNAFAAWTPVANDGGAALKTQLTAQALINLTLTVKQDLENTTVQHGDSSLV